MSRLLTSLGRTGRRIVLGHTLNPQTLIKTDEQKKKKILSKFTMLSWATFIAILGYMCPAGWGLDRVITTKERQRATVTKYNDVNSFPERFGIQI